MPAYTIDLGNPQDVLRILLTLVSRDGELRFKMADYDELERGKLLIIDRDKKKGEIVIRATTDYGSVVKVSPEAHQWTLPMTEAPVERARLRAEEAAKRRSLMSDEQLAEAEDKMIRDQQIATDVEAGKSPTRLRIRP